jgi:CHASE1-domain containing sensor protein
MADFETWQYQNLVQFAKEATQRMNLLNAEIEALNEDLKTAIEAYRHLLRSDSLGLFKGSHPAETQEARQ